MLRLLSTAMFLATHRMCVAASLDTQLNNNTSAVLISTNETSPRAYGLIHFEGQNEPNLNFQNEPSLEENQKQVIFKDDSSVPEVSQNVISNGINRLKKKRRRKKQRPVQFNGMPQTNQFLGPPRTYPGQILPYPSFGAQPYRPYPGPEPSLASQAFSTVTDALTSIGRYDDYQCVPRLLCEAAGGGSLGNSQLLQSVSRLQPLLTILSAYNGISTNPLFVFGRAVFLGVSSKENSASCRYAYPLCPTDTEQLVHYLNNYNGGFFRFFSAPQQEQHQELGVEQFYNQLSSYGLYQSNQNPNTNRFPYNPNQYYGFYQPNPNGYGLYQQHQKPNTQEQHYGLYQSNEIPNRFSNNQNGQNQYGLQRPGLYSLGNRYDYGSGYPYQNQIQYKNLNESKIEKRIQNRPNFDFIQDDEEPSWKFPLENEVIKDNYVSNYNMNFHKNRKGKLVFPDSVNNNDLPDDNFESFNKYLSHENYVTETSSVRKDRKLKFPAEFGNNSDYDNYRTENYGIGNINNNDNDSGSRDFIFPENKNNGHYYTYTRENDKLETGNRYVKMTNEFVNMPYDDGSQTVYIVRGNGDPNRPEVIKLKPGEMIK